MTSDAAPAGRGEERAADVALAVLRVGIALLMLRHGIPKLLEFGTRVEHFPDPLGVGRTASLCLAIFGEVFCSLLLVPGILTRLVAIPFVVTMLVAAVLVHAGDDFDTREMAVLYLMVGTVVLIGGGRRFSVDAWLLPRLRARFGPRAKAGVEGG